MNNIIKSYIANITKSNIKDFALKNNIVLLNNELDIVYNIIKNEWEVLLSDSDSVFLKYEDQFTDENYIKINTIFKEYKKRYKNYL